MKRNRWNGAVILMIVMLLILTGCGQGTKDTNGAAVQVGTEEKANQAKDIDKSGTKQNIVQQNTQGELEIVEIQVMTPDSSAPARANNFVKAADTLNTELEREKSKQRVKVNAVVKTMKDDEYKQNFIFASKSGNAADIYATPFSNIGWMSDGGYLLKLDGIEKADVFKNLMAGYWNAVTWNKSIWGVIQDTEARPVFFWKPALKKLGWSDAQIAELPGKAEKGELTIADMTEIAKKAVDKKIVTHGLLPTNGSNDLAMLFYSQGTQFYDNDANQFVFDKANMTNTFNWYKQMVDQKLIPASAMTTPKDDALKAMINGESMFLIAGIWDEAKWRTRGMHKETGNVTTEFIMDNIGMMLMPPSKKGGKPLTVSNPWTYVVSKDTKHPELVKRMLTHVSVPELQKEHGVQSSHIPFTKEGQELVKDNVWLSAVNNFIRYSMFVPNHPDFPKFAKIYTDALKNVSSGEKPEETVKWMEEQMKLNLEKVTVK